MVVTMLQVLLAELAGVAVCTGVMYAYWNLFTKKRTE